MSLSLSNWNVSVRLPESLSASFGSMWFGFCPAPQPPDSPGESLLPMCILLGETIATARCYKYSTVVLEHPRLLEWFRKQLLHISRKTKFRYRLIPKMVPWGVTWSVGFSLRTRGYFIDTVQRYDSDVSRFVTTRPKGIRFSRARNTIEHREKFEARIAKYAVFESAIIDELVKYSKQLASPITNKSEVLDEYETCIRLCSFCTIVASQEDCSMVGARLRQIILYRNENNETPSSVEPSSEEEEKEEEESTTTIIQEEQKKDEDALLLLEMRTKQSTLSPEESIAFPKLEKPEFSDVVLPTVSIKRKWNGKRHRSPQTVEQTVEGLAPTFGSAEPTSASQRFVESMSVVHGILERMKHTLPSNVEA